jgi:hypothetical protein
MATLNTPKSGAETVSSGAESKALRVVQPRQLEELGQILETIDALNMRVSEKQGEDRSGDMGGAGMARSSGAGTTGTSARDELIAAMPSMPIVRKKLEKHIQQEIRELKKKAEAGSLKRAGGAHALNELYSRIRRLQSLLRDLWDATSDVLKRLYVRVFVDKQTII